MDKIKNFWSRFLESSKRPSDTQYLEAFQATGVEVPKKGNFSIITDWDNNPRCVIETK